MAIVCIQIEVIVLYWFVSFHFDRDQYMLSVLRERVNPFVPISIWI